MRTPSTVVALAISVMLVAPAHAGRSCEQKQPSVQSITRGLALAETTRAALEASGADVVILARAGQDLRKYGLHYSHLGFAYRERGPDGASAWRVLHKLNRCGTADSAIYRQGLGEFFLDDPWRYEAAWVQPSREVQDTLLPLLRDSRRVVALHHKPYSIVSYAWGSRYQQSNQWLIETMVIALQPSASQTRQQAQGWLMHHGYRPATLTIGPITRLAGRMTTANVAFDDHPPANRFSDRIETVTVESVFEWMQRSGLAGRPVTLE